MERQGVAGGCNARRITEAGILFTVKKNIHPSFSGLFRACELLQRKAILHEEEEEKGGAGLGGKHTDFSGSLNEPARGESRGQPETVFLHLPKQGRVYNLYTDSLKCHFQPTLLSSLFTGE